MFYIITHTYIYTYIFYVNGVARTCCILHFNLRYVKSKQFKSLQYIIEIQDHNKMNDEI